MRDEIQMTGFYMADYEADEKTGRRILCENSDIILKKKVCDQTRSNEIYNRVILLSITNNCIPLVQ